MKKITAILLTLSLTLGLCAFALASSGDATIWYSSSGNGYSDIYLENALISGNSVYCFFSGSSPILRIMDLDTGSVRDLDMAPLNNSLYQAAEGDGDSFSYREIAIWFSWHDQIFAAVSTTSSDQGERNVEGGTIYRLDLTGDQPALTESELPQLDWSLMLTTESDGVYSRYVHRAFCVGDTLYALANDNTGTDSLVCFDLTDGSGTERFPRDISDLSPGPEGQLMFTRYNAEGDGSFDLVVYDPVSESEELRANFPITEYYPQGFCYRAETDTLYYFMGGELWAAPGFDLDQAVAVNDCPISYSSILPQITPGGMILLSDGMSVILRNTDPATRQSATLRIRDNSYVNAMDVAYHTFTSAFNDISVVIDRSGGLNDLQQAIMNQDSTVDIYTIDMASLSFSALLNRGFMAPLDSSEVLCSLVDSMYPAVKESVRRDGHLYCVPLSAYGYTLGIDKTAFLNAGFTEADIPTSWDGFFDLLERFPQVADGKPVKAFAPYYTVQDLKISLFDVILESYQNYLNAGNDASYKFTTPVMLEILDRLDALNYEALGIMEEYSEENNDWVEHGYVFETGTPVTIPSYISDAEPLLLSFSGEKPIGSYRTTVAFVNPYSTHITEAIAFLEAVANNIDKTSAYTFSPENNEPVRYPSWEQYKASLAESIEQTKAQLENATDENRESLEEMLSMLEKELEDQETGGWEISPDSIASYQARAEQLVPMSYDFFRLVIDSNDASFTEILSRFYQGESTPRDLLEAIDQKYQMMRLEGN